MFGCPKVCTFIIGPHSGPYSAETISTYLNTVGLMPLSKSRPIEISLAIGLLVGMLVSLPVVRIVDSTVALTWLMDEEGIIEAVGALGCLTGSIVLGVTFFVGRRRARENEEAPRPSFFILLLALGLLVMFGEEASWGQRLIGYDSPEVIAEYNTQSEVNLHNLRMFQPRWGVNYLHPLWLAGTIGYLGVCPFVGVLARRLEQFGIPVASRLVGGMTLCALVSVWLVSTLFPHWFMPHEAMEILESVFEVLYLVFAIDLYRRYVTPPRAIVSRRLGVVVALVILPLAALHAYRWYHTPTEAFTQQKSGIFAQAALEALERGETEEALQLLETSLKFWSADPLANYMLGNMQSEQGELAAAQAHFEQAILGSPDFPEAHNNLATVLAKQGHRAAAIQHLEMALELKPDYEEAARNLAALRSDSAR